MDAAQAPAPAPPAPVPVPPTPHVQAPAPGMVGGGGAPPAQVPPPPPLASSSQQAGEGTTQYVGRLVSAAVGKHEEKSKKLTTALAVTGVLAVLAVIGAVGVAVAAGSEDRAFQRIVREHEESVFLVESGIRVGDDYVAMGWGTGFAIDEHHIITNKHVLYSPNPQTACRIAFYESVFGREGVQRVFTVWRGGTRFRQSVNDRSGDLGRGLSTDNGMLKLVRTAPDNFAPAQEVGCTIGNNPPFRFQWRRPLQDNNDLALLRTNVTLKPLPLASDEPEPDDPVLVFGFPEALAPMETTEADPIRMRGTVVRIQETIQIDAVVMSGNSGGPLINADGEVVGVTTRGLNNDLFNMAIKVEWVRNLLIERVR